MATSRFTINEDIAQRLVAFELDDVEWVNGVRKPGVKIGFVSDLSNDIADLVSPKQRSGTHGPAYRSLLSEFSESALCIRTEKEADRARAELGRSLAEAGFSVNTDFRYVHRIYVVNLKSSPLKGDDRPSVYVGQTTNPIDERISQHISGTKKATTWKLMTVRREDLEPGDAYLSHSTYNAEVLESAWGRELEARGFRVFGPRGFSRSKKSRSL